jgi:type I restriction enzyme M protein
MLAAWQAEQDASQPARVALPLLIDLTKEGMSDEDAVALLLLLAVVRSRQGDHYWNTLCEADPSDLDGLLRSAVLSASYSMSGAEMLKDDLPAEALARAVEAFSRLDPPIVKRAVDWLLEYEVTSKFSPMGLNMYPPSSLRKLMIAVAQPRGYVYDATSGTGQLLVDAALAGNSAVTRLFGSEESYSLCQMAMLNLEIHELSADLFWDNHFVDHYFAEERADCVVAAPPWNTKLRAEDRVTGDPRWVWGEPGPNDRDAAWIQHCLYHLADGGRAVILLPNSVLFEGGRFGRIRQRIIKAGLLDAVIALPPHLLAGTDQPCSLLVFTKGRPHLGGKPAPTLMVDLTDAIESDEKRPATLADELIDDVAQLYRRWTSGEEPSSGYASIARFDDLSDNDFVIDPRRYRSLSSASHDLDVPLLRSNLVEQLGWVIRECDEADELIQDHLEEMRVVAFEQVRLGDLSSVVTVGKGFPTQRAQADGEVRVMSVAALRSRTPPRYFADRDAIREVGMEPAAPGDVLVAIEGSTLGEAYVVSEDDDEFVPSQQVATLRVIDRGKLDPSYLGAWLMTETALERIRRLARGSANQRIPIRDLASLTVMLPSMTEQRAIGQRFVVFEAAIQSHRSVITCLEQLRRLELVATFANVERGAPG